MRAQPLLGGGVSAATARAFVSERDEGMIPAIAADGSLFPIGKLEAHERGAFHLAVSVFVMAGDALLLQRRALTKYHCGGLWANTCCSHPAWGETPAAGAQRRLHEELGLTLALSARNIIDYEADVTNGLRECERVHVYRAEANRATLAITPNPEEVSEVRWMRLRDLRSDAAKDPAAYAPWFRIYLARWNELGLH